MRPTPSESVRTPPARSPSSTPTRARHVSSRNHDARTACSSGEVTAQHRAEARTFDSSEGSPMIRDPSAAAASICSTPSQRAFPHHFPLQQQPGDPRSVRHQHRPLLRPVPAPFHSQLGHEPQPAPVPHFAVRSATSPAPSIPRPSTPRCTVLTAVAPLPRALQDH